jgi:hypothetical protein
MSEYWDAKKTQPNLQAFRDEWDGSIQCGCDHGCNDWLLENAPKASLIMSIMTNPGATTSPDKVTQMDVTRAARIWHRIARWQSQKWNREFFARERQEREDENG